MKTLAFAAAALAAAASIALPAGAAIADWKKARHIDVAMTDHGFVPAQIEMKSGGAYVLRFVNRSSRGHDFTAKSFFKEARVEPADGRKVRSNKVDLDSGRSTTVRVIAPTTPGAQYEYKSGHVTDAASGLKGAIFVR